MTTASVGFHCPECVSSKPAHIQTSQKIFNFDPMIVKVLIAANVLLFVIGVAMGDGVQGQIVSDGLLIRGGLNANLDGWYRVVTSGFLHYGFVHLGFNMYALWLLGPAFERSLGRLRFTLFYFAALTSGSFGAMIWTPNGLTVGASGAIFGLLGLATVAQRSSGYSLWKSGLGMVLLFNFLLTFTVSSISVGGHLGGFVAGLVVGWLVFELPKKTDIPQYLPEVVITIGAAMAYVGTLFV